MMTTASYIASIRRHRYRPGSRIVWTGHTKDGRPIGLCAAEQRPHLPTPVQGSGVVA